MATLHLSLLLILACAPDGSNAGVEDTPGASVRAKSAVSLADLSSGDLLITEIMQNPAAVSDSYGEWFEVTNDSGSTVDLDGLEVSDTAGSGFTVSGTLEVAAGGRVVFGRRTDKVVNGGADVDYQYGSSINLGNGTDDLILAYGGTTFDMVSWDNGATMPDPNGASMNVDAESGDWCESTSPFGTGDRGTPGTVNDGCGGDTSTDASPLASLGDGDLIITEILHDPAAVSDVRGEWFEVFNDSGASLDLDGLEVWDSAGQGFTVSGTLVVADGGRVVFGRNASGSNGGVTLDQAYGSALTLGNGSDDLSVGYAGVAFDTVSWDNGVSMPDPKGASINLGPAHRDADENDSASAWCVSTSVFGDGDLGTPGSVNDSCTSDAEATLADLASGELVITEVMQNPAKVTDSAGEWFEVRNTSSLSVDLQGLFVYDTGWDMFMVTNSLVVDAGDTVVFGRNSATSINGGVDVDYAYGGNMSLGNSSDTVVLAWGGTLFDAVSWDNGASFPDPRGASMSLDASLLDATDNDDGGNWCASTSTYGSGDAGTPGGDNDSCPGVSGPNSAPVISAVSLTPSSVATDDTLTAAVSAVDAQGDAISLAYAWTVNGSTVAETGATLDGATDFDRDDSVQVTVTPSDATSTGVAVSSAAVTVANTAPTAPVAAVSPTNPAEGDDLVCTLSTESADVDGDSVSYSVAWTVDGSSTSSSTTTHTGDTVLASATAADQSWTCVVTATDGTDTAVSGTSSVTVSTEICPVFADPSVAPGGNGSSADPYPSIAYAMAYRGTCDEVVLQPGTYDEQLDYGGEDVHIRSSGGPEVTIIEPSIGGTAVSFVDAETESAVLEGVTVRGGDDSGIRIDSADPTILDCIIEDNTATNGAGVYASGYNGSFTGNIVRDNTATSYAGGLYLYLSSAEVIGNTIETNDASYGDGVYIYTGDPTFSANVVDNNQGENLRVYNASALISNNQIRRATNTNVYLYYTDSSTLVNNTLTDSGAYNLRIYDTPNTVVVNNIIANSTSIEVYGSSSSSLNDMTYKNNLVYGTATHYYSVADQTGSSGNISANPQFEDSTNGDYSLAWGSLAIDNGTDASVYGVEDDFDAEPRAQGPGWDIGAFEYEGPTDDCDGTDDGDQCATACPVYVDPVATPGGNGAESDPYASIAYALAYRGDSCSELMLEPGSYDTTLDFGGEDLHIASTAGAASTLIEPSQGGRTVVFENGETDSATLEGLTISGGTTTGIYIDGASPTIQDCIIEGNSGTSGGGVYATGYDGTFTGNTVRDNEASSYAGGMYLHNSTAIVTANTFEANDGNYVGALYLYGGSPEVEANWFEGNTGGSQGGGIRIYSATALVANNVLVDNVGSGIYLYYTDSSTVVNNTIVGSTYGVYVYNVPSTVVMNNIIAESSSYDVYLANGSTSMNSLTWTHNNVWGGTNGYSTSSQTGTNENISQDPQFTDAASGDYSMVWGSNCIDHGTDVSTYGVSDDFTGAAREQGLGVDLGAIESY